MVEADRAKRVVDKMMHQAHLRYQKEVLSGDKPAAYVVTLECAEVRGVRYKSNMKCQFKPEWFTHLRPNFWKAYFDTLVRMKA